MHCAGRKEESEVEKALVREVGFMGGPMLQARPDLRNFSASKGIGPEMELDAVALGNSVAYIAEHEATPAMDKEGGFK